MASKAVPSKPIGAAAFPSYIETHPDFLHVTLLETNPSEILNVADGVNKRLDAIRESRTRDRRFDWREGRLREPIDSGQGGSEVDAHYRPRTYFTSGTFDLAVAFLSPTLEMTSWLQAPETLKAGHDSNICLLPKASGLFSEDVPDFNRCFLDGFQRKRAPRSGPLATEHRFASFTKLKLNPLVIWAEVGDEGDSSEQFERIKTSLRLLWKKINDWREIHPGAQAALGLAFGWNEILLVAHADTPGALMDLTLRVRQTHTDTTHPANRKKREKTTSHLALTTLTTIGHDIVLRERARDALRKEKVGADGRIPAQRLIDLARKIVGSKDVGEPEQQKSCRLFVQIGCYSYPGHERTVLELLFELEQRLRKEKILKSGRFGPACIDVGKRDIWTPYFPFSSAGLGPTGMAVLVSLIQIWLRNSGARPLLKDTADKGIDRHIPASFDFYTRIGWSPALALDERDDSEAFARLLDEASLEELPGDHVAGLPRKFLTPDPVERYLNQVFKERHGFLAPLREAMRELQLPYALSEQIFNVTNIFYWAHNREVIWDESVELISPILAFASFLEERKKEWQAGLENYRGLEEKLNKDVHGQLLEKEKRAIEVRLEELPERQVEGFLQAMRAYFYTTQFSNYLMGEMPDLNLRFKGSLHQLLRMSNMIFDSLVDVVMGPRACLAIITDTLSPKVSMYCDVPVVELNSSTFTNLLVLESLAHEVSHLFLLDLADWYRRARPNEENDRIEGHLWTGAPLLPKEKKEALKLVWETYELLESEVFVHQLSKPGTPDFDAAMFLEATADFMEAELLGCGVELELYSLTSDSFEDVAFERWLKRFVVRILLSTGSVTLGEEDPKGALGQSAAPQLNKEMVISAILRAALVVSFRYTLQATIDYEEDTFEVRALKQDLLEGPLARLRILLREECILGLDTPLLRAILHEEGWHVLMNENVLSAKFFEDRYAIAATVNFHEALKAHLDAALDSPRESYRGVGQLWPTIRDAFEGLWSGWPSENAQKSEGIGDLLRHAVFIQHCVDDETRQDLRDGQAVSEKAKRSWKAHLQPLARHWRREAAVSKGGNESIEPPEVRLHFFQRGRLQPVSDDDLGVWNQATHRFLTQLLPLVPAWHRSVLDEIRRVLELQGKNSSDDERAQVH